MNEKWFIICYDIKKKSFANSSEVSITKETEKQIIGKLHLLSDGSYKGTATINKNKRNVVFLSVTSEGNGAYKNPVATYKVLVKAENKETAFEVGKELITTEIKKNVVELLQTSYNEAFMTS